MAFNELTRRVNESFVRVQSKMDNLDSFAINNQFDNYQNEERIISEIMNKALADIERLEVLSRKEPLITRSQSKMQVDQLRYDYNHIQSAIRTINMKMRRKQEEIQEREQLLTTRFVSNRSTESSDQTKILIEHGLEEHKRLSSSVNHMNHIIETGEAIMSSLTEQKKALISGHRQMMDMLTTLGLSQSVMKMIERRSSHDYMIFCVCCVLILCLLFLLWRFVV